MSFKIIFPHSNESENKNGRKNGVIRNSIMKNGIILKIKT